MSARQIDAILRYMQRGFSLTSTEAWALCGCRRLAARIYDLKQRGYAIYARRDRGLARYWLSKRK